MDIVKWYKSEDYLKNFTNQNWGGGGGGGGVALLRPVTGYTLIARDALP